MPDKDQAKRTPVPQTAPRVTRTVDRFLESLTLNHGPIELVSRFLIKAVSAAAHRGVYLEMGTFDEYLEINRANLASWRPLATSWRTDIGGADDRSGYVLIGRDARGAAVATSAAKHLDWSATNFKAEAESLRLFYADPERDSQPGEACFVSAPNAAEIRGRVLHSGGVWYRPDYRGRQLAQIIPRIGRVYANARWDIENVFAYVSAENTKTGFEKRTGYSDITRWITLRDSPSYPGQDVRLVLLRMQEQELWQDAMNFLVRFDTKANAVVGKRSA